jgi:hypothetical protein
MTSWVPGSLASPASFLSLFLVAVIGKGQFKITIRRRDNESKQQFMVDTGAGCSVLPHRLKMPPTGPPLSGADGKDIPCWGSLRCRLTFGLRTFFVTFLLAAVYRPIFGLDFLSAQGLLVDPVSRQVLDSKSLKPFSEAKTAARVVHSKFAAALCSIAPTVRSLLALFPTIVSDGKGQPSPKHKIRHTIETMGCSVFAKARHLDPDKLCQAEAEFCSLRRLASSIDQIRPGHRCTWSARKTGHGGHAVITAASTWQRHTTATPYPASSTSPASCTAANSSPASTW